MKLLGFARTPAPMRIPGKAAVWQHVQLAYNRVTVQWTVIRRTHVQFPKYAYQELAPVPHLGIGALESTRVCEDTSIASRVASFNTAETSSFDPATIVNARS